MMKTTSLAKCLPVAFLLSCGAAVKADVKDTGTNDKPQSTPVAGNTCAADEECITGEVCDETAKKCAPTCADDSDCEGKLVCIDTNEKMYCGTKDVECEEDLDCEAGKICGDDGQCKTPRCAPLGKDVCPTGYGCFQGACVKQQANSACMNAADCNTVAACKTDKCDCVANKCQPKAATVTCTAANQATVCKAGEVCDGGVCKTPAVKNCTNDVDCPGPFYCKASDVPGTSPTCEPGCKDDLDCTGGLKCDVSGTHQCVPPGSIVKAACHSDEDCEPGCLAAVAADDTYVSAKVCDFRMSDTLGGKSGVCRDRCSQTMYLLSPNDPAPFPLGEPGLTCKDTTYTCTAISVVSASLDTTVSLEKESSCGGGLIGGYSSCVD